MDVQVTKASGIMSKVDVAIPWEQVSQKYKDAVNRAKQVVNIPGFRKGKAPVTLVTKRFGKEINDDFARAVLPDQMPLAIKQLTFEALGEPRIQDFKVKKNEDFTFTFFVEHAPDFELNDWRGVDVETLNINVTDEDVDQHIQGLIEKQTQTHDITERGAQDGDKISLDLTVLDSAAGETLTDVEDYQVELGQTGAHPIIAAMLADVKAGDSVEQDHEIEEDHHFNEWNGKTVKVILDVKKITLVEKAELNDAFAKSQGADDVESYKAKLKADMQKSKQEQEEKETSFRILKQLVQAYNFEVPPSLVQEEINRQMQRMMPYMQGMEQYLQDQAFLERLYRDMLPSATEAIRSNLLLQKIGEDAELDISEADVDQELADYATSMNKSVEDVLKDQDTDAVRNQAKKFLVQTKVLEMLRKEANLTFVDELTPENPPAEEAPPAEESAAETEEPSEVGGAQAETATENAPADQTEETVAADETTPTEETPTEEKATN